MRGVILAGGLGSRLLPLTKVTNKHLLPVYHKPMIYYPIELLVEAGIRDIMIVTGGSSSGEFMRLLGNGKDLGLDSVNYAYQEGEGGIAEALSLAQGFSQGEKVIVVLGDNMVQKSIKAAVQSFSKQKEGAKILIKEVEDPERFGVVEFSGKKIARIIEKPKKAPSRFAVVGIYMYDARVFEIVKTLKRSNRGELEITDVNNQYIEEGLMTYDVLDGWWKDAGTFESLYQSSCLMRDKHQEKIPLKK